MKMFEYRFAITPLFHFIASKSMEAGLHVCDGRGKQTVQLFMNDAASEKGKKRIGAIQYEGSKGSVPVTRRSLSKIDRDRESYGSLSLFLLYSCNHNFYVSQYNIVRCTSRLFCMYLSKEGEITWEEGIFWIIH